MNVERMRCCKKCGEVRPISEFHLHPDCKDGRRPTCKACSAENGKRWADANREKVRARGRKWHANNKEKDLARIRMRHYGLDEDGYGGLISRHTDGEGRVICGSCGRVVNSAGQSGNAKNVDHIHGSTVVRGILCGNCNRGVGLLGDTLNGVLGAVDYLATADVRGWMMDRCMRGDL